MLLLTSLFVVVDVDENQLFALSRKSVLNFSPDITEPSLVSFNLNLTAGQLILTFDETVNVSSFNVTSFSIHNRANLSQATTSYQLTGGSVSRTNDPVVVVSLSPFDLNNIKANTELASSNDSTYLSFTTSAVNDMSANVILASNPEDAPNVEVFSPDSLPSEFISFELDLNSGIVTLTFTETVDANTFDPTRLHFANENATSVYTLSGGEILNEKNQTWIQLRLSVQDLNDIKALTDLATSKANTFLRVEQRSVYDMNFNEAERSESLPARDFVEDKTAPELVRFDLDLNVGTLTAFFTETVNVKSLAVDQISRSTTLRTTIRIP